MTSAPPAAEGTSYASQLVRITQLERSGIRISLKGFWVAVIPPGLLRYAPRGVQLSRWKLGCLLEDVDQLLHDKDTGSRLAR